MASVDPLSPRSSPRSNGHRERHTIRTNDSTIEPIPDRPRPVVNTTVSAVIAGNGGELPGNGRALDAAISRRSRSRWYRSRTSSAMMSMGGVDTTTSAVVGADRPEATHVGGRADPFATAALLVSPMKSFAGRCGRERTGVDRHRRVRCFPKRPRHHGVRCYHIPRSNDAGGDRTRGSRPPGGRSVVRSFGGWERGSGVVSGPRSTPRCPLLVDTAMSAVVIPIGGCGSATEIERTFTSVGEGSSLGADSHRSGSLTNSVRGSTSRGPVGERGAPPTRRSEPDAFDPAAAPASAARRTIGPGYGGVRLQSDRPVLALIDGHRCPRHHPQHHRVRSFTRGGHREERHVENREGIRVENREDISRRRRSR